MDFNIHPPLTAFPLALSTVVVILQILNLFLKSKKIDSLIEINLFITMLATIATFFSGYQAADHASTGFQVSQDLIATHHTIGRLILFTIIPCFFSVLFIQSRKI